LFLIVTNYGVQLTSDLRPRGLTDSVCPVCSCPIDELFFKKSKQLVDHLHGVHQWDVVGDAQKLSRELDLNFESDRQFAVWKQALESKTCSQYSKQTGTRRNKGTSVEVYSCITDGAVTAGGLERPLRSKPNSRLGTHCLSRIRKITYEDGSSAVDFIPVHTSHSVSPFESIQRQHLSSTTKNAVRHMSAAGKSKRTIVETIQGDTTSRLNRDQFDAVVHRDLFITVQDVKNLRTLDLEQGLRKHADDMFSLHLWVMQLKTETYNPVLYYKPPGMHDPLYPNVPTNELLLVLATVAMLDSICRNVSVCVYVCVCVCVFVTCHACCVRTYVQFYSQLIRSSDSGALMAPMAPVVSSTSMFMSNKPSNYPFVNSFFPLAVLLKLLAFVTINSAKQLEPGP
jgi:hypothetical protein